MPPSEATPKPVAPARLSSGALPVLCLAALLLALGAGASVYQRSLEAEARDLAAEISSSVVPDEALVPSAVKGARAENAALGQAVGARFAPRAEPVVALRAIEAAADAIGVDSAFTRVEVGGWDGDPEHLDQLAYNAATSSPYAAVVASVQASGPWAQALSLAASLDELPLASRVDALRLAAGLDERGRPIWTVAAEVSVIAK